MKTKYFNYLDNLIKTGRSTVEDAGTWLWLDFKGVLDADRTAKIITAWKETRATKGA